MKKFHFAALLSVVAVLSLSSCWSSPQNSQAPAEEYVPVSIDSLDVIIGSIQRDPNVALVEQGEEKYVEVLDDGFARICNLKIIYNDAAVKDSTVVIYEPYDREHSSLETESTRMILPEPVKKLMSAPDVQSAEITSLTADQTTGKNRFCCKLTLRKQDGSTKDTTVVLRTLK